MRACFSVLVPKAAPDTCLPTQSSFYTQILETGETPELGVLDLTIICIEEYVPKRLILYKR